MTQLVCHCAFSPSCCRALLVARVGRGLLPRVRWTPVARRPASLPVSSRRPRTRSAEEPVRDQLPDGRPTGPARRRVTRRAAGQRVQDLRRRVQRRRRRRRPGRPRPCRPARARRIPRCWRSTIVSGSSAPGAPDRLLRGRRRAAVEPARRAGRVVGGRAAESVRRSAVGDLARRAAARPVGPLLEAAAPAPVDVGPAQVHPAEADRLDALLARTRPARRRSARRSRGAPCTPGVLEPQLDVLRAGRRPRAAPPRRRSRCRPASRRPAPARARRAGAPSWRAPGARRRGEVAAAPRRRSARHLVAGQPGVAVDQPLAGGRRDHERRVGHDQVEPLAARPARRGCPRGRRRRTVVERGVEPGQRSARGLTSVATTWRGVRGEVQAWTPQPVPRSSARSTRSRTVSCASERGGRADPEHVVAADRVRRRRRGRASGRWRPRGRRRPSGRA